MANNGNARKANCTNRAPIGEKSSPSDDCFVPVSEFNYHPHKSPSIYGPQHITNLCKYPPYLAGGKRGEVKPINGTTGSHNSFIVFHILWCWSIFPPPLDELPFKTLISRHGSSKIKEEKKQSWLPNDHPKAQSATLRIKTIKTEIYINISFPFRLIKDWVGKGGDSLRGSGCSKPMNKIIKLETIFSSSFFFSLLPTTARTNRGAFKAKPQPEKLLSTDWLF